METVTAFGGSGLLINGVRHSESPSHAPSVERGLRVTFVASVSPRGSPRSLGRHLEVPRNG